MTFALRNTINFLVLPFTVSLSKAVSSFVKCDFYSYFLYRVVWRITRDKVLRQGLGSSKPSINVGSTFDEFKVEIQKNKIKELKEKKKAKKCLFQSVESCEDNLHHISSLGQITEDIKELI